MLRAAVFALSHLLLPGAVAATAGPGHVCKDFHIAVNVTVPYYDVDLSIETHWDLVDYIFNSTRRDSSEVFHPVGRNHTETTTSKIGATFCRPRARGKTSETVLLLTHGSMVDRSYWNPVFAGSEQYNFVQHALDAGYSVFFYDRLGSGTSDRPSPITQVQFAPQVAILNSLTRLLQRSSSPYTLNTPIRKVVHIGHSFGAFVAAAALATAPPGTTTTPGTLPHPAPGDALVLTGFSGRFEWLSLFTAGGQARVAALQFPHKWAHLPHGYMVPVDAYAAAYGGFRSPFFDRRVAEWLYEHQSPYAIGEALTAGAWALDFGSIAVPVQVVQGRYDLTACGGNCGGVLDGTAALFTGSPKVEVNGDFEGGHNLNFHYEAKKSYEAIIEFVREAV
ncbi:alpha/beta-hydrolase [Parathielavia appendiculata]|uniref:Alpha/beta-hydrolase n=1 Tax=Parathielavia appendiculata TaxID=2587402 RepID=A0AAN6YZ74_9PEZI|nr:alpha/beta-hydrolase [Parathielavia appendiculata]